MFHRILRLTLCIICMALALASAFEIWWAFPMMLLASLVGGMLPMLALLWLEPPRNAAGRANNNLASWLAVCWSGGAACAIIMLIDGLRAALVTNLVFVATGMIPTLLFELRYRHYRETKTRIMTIQQSSNAAHVSYRIAPPDVDTQLAEAEREALAAEQALEKTSDLDR